MSAQERDFKGVWIPKEIWLDKRLNALEKVILTEIDSLDNGERGCFASNKHIADFCQCSERSVTGSISKLVEIGYIFVESFDGRQRILRSRLAELSRQGSKFCEAESQKLQESNTSNNTLNNSSKKKERKTATSYDSILSDIVDDDLRDLYLEYIKMRKLIKAPMTDRALTILISKVNQLEPNDVERQKRLLETSIANNWKSVYPLKDEPKPQKSVGFDLDEFFDAACLDSERKRIENPPKTAADDETIRKRAEALKNEFSKR